MAFSRGRLSAGEVSVAAKSTSHASLGGDQPGQFIVGVCPIVTKLVEKENLSDGRNVPGSLCAQARRSNSSTGSVRAKMQDDRGQQARFSVHSPAGGGKGRRSDANQPARVSLPSLRAKASFHGPSRFDQVLQASKPFTGRVDASREANKGQSGPHHLI